MKNIVFLILVILDLIIIFSLTYYFQIITQRQCMIFLMLSFIIVLLIKDLFKINFF